MHLPVQTSEIFERLCRGQFLSANSNEPSQRRLYQLAERHFEDLSAYFAVLKLQLRRGEAYIYLTRETPRSLLEEKFERLGRYFQALEVLLCYRPDLRPGQTFIFDELLQACESRTELRKRLAAFAGKSGEKNAERLLALLRTLEKEGFIEAQDESRNVWRVLAALHYLTHMLQRTPTSIS